jgi:hypothetical protein
MNHWVLYVQHCAIQDIFLILLIAVSSFGESLRWDLPHRPGGDLFFNVIFFKVFLFCDKERLICVGIALEICKLFPKHLTLRAKDI